MVQEGPVYGYDRGSNMCGERRIIFIFPNEEAEQEAVYLEKLQIVQARSGVLRRQ